MSNDIFAFSRLQTLGEEIANSISHGVGALAALIGAPFLMVAVSQHGSASYIIGATIFICTLLLLYTTSTVYHALPSNRAKPVFQILDHSAIFLLIAGTYTPFTLGPLYGTWGWTLFAIIWAVAVLGVVLKSIRLVRYAWLSTALYLAMGWLIVIAAKPFLQSVPMNAIVWLAAGGVFYTLGIPFFAKDEKVKYCHFVWHLFVLAGSTCHFFAVLNLT